MKNNSKTGIVIDSTTILSQEDIKNFGVKIVSLNVQTLHFVKKEVETTDQEIIDDLENVSSLRSSSPSPADFVLAYNELFAEGYTSIIVLSLSSALSSTYQSAEIARSYSDAPDSIYVCDTKLANYGVANVIESLLPLFDEGQSFETIVETSKQRVLDASLQFTIIDIKHLVNGGRLSRFTGLLGALLHIKPIIKMTDGKLDLYKKERNFNNVFSVFINFVGGYVDKFKHVAVKVVDLMQNVLAEKLVGLLKESFGQIKITRISTVGPTFLIHLGNNGVGISVVAYN